MPSPRFQAQEFRERPAFARSEVAGDALVPARVRRSEGHTWWTRTVPSFGTVNTRSPDGEKIAECTLSEWPRSRATSFPSRSHKTT